jgi:hypothetical protein
MYGNQQKGPSSHWQTPFESSVRSERRCEVSAVQVSCRRCAAAVDIHTAAQTFGYCRECQPALPGMAAAVSDQTEAAGAQQGKELTRRIEEPGRDISARAGETEREAPLFFGTGDNPGLFRVN